MFTGPRDGPLGDFIKIARGRETRRCFIVIALYDRATQFANAFHAFSRVGVIADHIAKAHEARAFARARVSQHGFQRLEIAVNIAENGESHERLGQS